MTSTSAKMLKLELQRLKKSPVEGFTISLVDDSDIYHWQCNIFGPPDTIYAGAYFKAILAFPHDYPFSPPKFRFTSKMYHPNIYKNGDLCISILHPPGNDPRSGELACERWNPTQTVRTILLSVISLLVEPNTNSPANIEASLSFRKYQSKENAEYKEVVERLVKVTKLEAEEEGVKVPNTREEYCMASSSGKVASSGDFESACNGLTWQDTMDDMSEFSYQPHAKRPRFESSSDEDDGCDDDAGDSSETRGFGNDLTQGKSTN